MTHYNLGQGSCASNFLVRRQREFGVETRVPLREIKMAITGRGSATKSQVWLYDGTTLSGLEFDEGEEDISDALATPLWLVMRCPAAHFDGSDGAMIDFSEGRWYSKSRRRVIWLEGLGLRGHISLAIR